MADILFVLQHPGIQGLASGERDGFQAVGMRVGGGVYVWGVEA